MAPEVWSVCTYERVYHRYNIWLQKYGLYVHMLKDLIKHSLASIIGFYFSL